MWCHLWFRQSGVLVLAKHLKNIIEDQAAERRRLEVKNWPQGEASRLICEDYMAKGTLTEYAYREFGRQAVWAQGLQACDDDTTGATTSDVSFSR